MTPPDRVAELLARAAAAGLDHRALEPLMKRMVETARNYAAIEQIVLGAVPLSFPAHLLLGDGASGEPLADGIRLAERERKRLGLEPGGTVMLARDVESEGVKLIPLPFPEKSRLLGAFVFDAEFGPAILVDASAGRRARDYAVAHEYGHFLADHDPYRTWVCRPDGGPDSPEELRAHAFAAALLVPGESLEEYLEARLTGSERIGAPLIGELATYFDADERAVVGRLLASGRIDADELPSLLSGGGVHGVEDDPTADGFPEGLSERHLRLAIMAWKRGGLDEVALARALGTDGDNALRLAQYFEQSDRGPEAT